MMSTSDVPSSMPLQSAPPRPGGKAADNEWGQQLPVSKITFQMVLKQRLLLQGEKFIELIDQKMAERAASTLTPR